MAVNQQSKQDKLERKDPNQLLEDFKLHILELLNSSDVDSAALELNEIIVNVYKSLYQTQMYTTTLSSGLLKKGSIEDYKRKKQAAVNLILNLLLSFKEASFFDEMLNKIILTGNGALESLIALLPNSNTEKMQILYIISRYSKSENFNLEFQKCLVSFFAEKLISECPNPLTFFDVIKNKTYFSNILDRQNQTYEAFDEMLSNINLLDVNIINNLHTKLSELVTEIMKNKQIFKESIQNRGILFIQDINEFLYLLSQNIKLDDIDGWGEFLELIREADFEKRNDAKLDANGKLSKLLANSGFQIDLFNLKFDQESYDSLKRMFKQAVMKKHPDRILANVRFINGKTEQGIKQEDLKAYITSDFQSFSSAFDEIEIFFKGMSQPDRHFLAES